MEGLVFCGKYIYATNNLVLLRVTGFNQVQGLRNQTRWEEIEPSKDCETFAVHKSALLPLLEQAKKEKRLGIEIPDDIERMNCLIPSFERITNKEYTQVDKRYRTQDFLDIAQTLKKLKIKSFDLRFDSMGAAVISNYSIYMYLIPEHGCKK